MVRTKISLVWCCFFFLHVALAGCSHQPSDVVDSDGLENDEIAQEIDSPAAGSVLTAPVTGVKSMLVTVTHWQGEHILDKAEVEKHTLSTDPDSFRSYILAASGGKLTLNGVVVESTSGPNPGGCGPSAVLAEGLKTAAANGLKIEDFDYQIHIALCGSGAIAHVPGNFMVVLGKPGSAHVYIHEFGHNLGYHHGSTYIRCPFDGVTIKAPNGCTLVGYGDTGDSVSGGGALYPAVNRWHSGWLDDKQAVTISRTGLYSLGVLGREGPQLYMVKIPEGNSIGSSHAMLSLEYRKPTRFDNFSDTDNRVNGVWMRYSRDAGNVLNVQIDATPETATTSDPTLQVGRVFEDDSGKVKVRVCSVGAQEAIIGVALNGADFPYCTTTVPAPVIDVPADGQQTGFKPIFAGSSWPGARIVVTTTDDPPEAVGATVADGHGKWSVQLSDARSIGFYSYTARQYFGPKYSVAAPPRHFEVAHLEPTRAEIETPYQYITTGQRPILGGRGIPGATVVLLQHNHPYDTLASTVVDGYGRWSAQVDNPLPVGPFNISGYQLIDGKRSGWLVGRSIQVVGEPDRAIIESPLQNVQTGRQPVFSGRGIAGALVVLLENGQPHMPLATATVGPDGWWSAKIDKPLPIRPFVVTGYQFLEGKRSGWLVARTVRVVDVPEPAIIDTPEKNAITGPNPTIAGTGVVGATVVLLQVNYPDTWLASAVVGGDGRWSVRIPTPLPARMFTLTGFQTVNGNRSGWITNHPINVVGDAASKRAGK